MRHELARWVPGHRCTREEMGSRLRQALAQGSTRRIVSRHSLSLRAGITMTDRMTHRCREAGPFRSMG